jgi:hypothetical protein
VSEPLPTAEETTETGTATATTTATKPPDAPALQVEEHAPPAGESAPPDDEPAPFEDAARPFEPKPFDESLLHFSAFVESLTADLGGRVTDEDDIASMSVEEVLVTMPVELEISIDENAHLVVGGAPPTQRTETSVMPVFHRLTLRLVRDEEV